MSNRILIAGSTETFSVKGLEMKLARLDAEIVFSELKLIRLESSCKDVSLIILYTDDNIDKEADALVYLKDYCIENEKKVIVIGTRAEYDSVCQLIPAGCIHAFYERPLDMEALIDDTELFLSEETSRESRKSILIVDDDVSYMSMIFDWLKDSYRVAMVNSGMQAITWIAKNRVDLILLDYEMPVTSGPQVLEMIRSEAETSDIPVMFLTGKGDKESILKVLSLKPTDYLLKTIDKKRLCEKVDSFFHQQAVSRVL